MVNPEQTAIAQVEFVGKPRSRHLRLSKIGHPKEFSSRRTSRVVAHLNETTGEMGFIPAYKACNIHPSDLPHLLMGAAEQADLTFQRPSLKTARRQKTSSAGVNMDEICRKRGGDPNYRPPKQGGFFFRSTHQELMVERGRKMAEARKRHIQYQSHP